MALLPRPFVNLVAGQNLQTLLEYYTKVTDANRDKARQVLDELMGEQSSWLCEFARLARFIQNALNSKFYTVV